MRNDGGAAFPGYDSMNAYRSGMSLRDYFAAAALQGLLAYGAQTLDENIPEETALTKDAYLFADAMLAEREKP